MTPGAQARPWHGFTLLELLLSLVLMAALFLALNQFVFSMAELWGHGAERRLLERHASAVAHHVQGMLRAASLRPGNEEALAMRGTLAEETDGRWLTLDLAAGDRVLAWPGRPLPDVVCALRIEAGEGLLLRWLSRLEPGFAHGSSRTVVLSPFGARLEYEYFDRQNASWLIADMPQRDSRGRWRVPDRLRLHFERDGHRTARTVQVPVPTAALPAY